MTARNIILVALPLLVTCKDGAQAPVSPVEAQQRALGTVPPTEVAVWQRVGLGSNPQGRFMQAAAWDDKRGVVVMFGGETSPHGSGTPVCNQETWEWSPTTGNWTNRTGTGVAPGARAGAAMVYDSTENIFVLFGGRTSSGVNYEDTWEWDPQSGAWTDRTSAGPHPSARTQHGMVYEKSSGKILLFGGGTSDTSAADGVSVSVTLKDTWEYSPVAHGWTDRSPSTGPGPRDDFGLVWDSSRNRAILVGGRQVDPTGATPVYKQDTWEWDPTGAGTWTDRTASDTKPSPRHGHAMAYDGTRKMVVLFGGSDANTTPGKSDLWDMNTTDFTWTQRLSGSEDGLPNARLYASLVSDNNSHLELVAGSVSPVSRATSAGFAGSNEIWELTPTTPAFTNRTVPRDVPPPRSDHAMAYNPTTKKVYLFGGYDQDTTSAPFNDFWEWDGKTWTQIVTNNGPPAALDAAMAYDPARKSIILYGGAADLTVYGDTWEWSSTTRQWTKLETTGNPGPRHYHAMVTDATRSKVLLFGDTTTTQLNHVWEWDGSRLTWTDRTSVSVSTMPRSRNNPIIAYDDGRQRVFLYDGNLLPPTPMSDSAFWEWDPATAGWTRRDPGDTLRVLLGYSATYDPARRRIVIQPTDNIPETWELDAKTATWYVRTLSSAPSNGNPANPMVFDSARGVAVMFGGGGGSDNQTWEYKVTNLGNGEGCTSASASTCASGNCVDGVCCESASCTGACKSCNVPGSEGTCKLAQAGTEVPGSCESSQACDGTGTCKSKNGQACAGNATCASGFCVDGICCDSACTGKCVACNLTGRAGQCSPQPLGSDPGGDCTEGTGACKATCDGAGNCDFPGYLASCGACAYCDGKGTCSLPYPNCVSTGGTTGTVTFSFSAKGGDTGTSSTGKGGNVSSSSSGSGGKVGSSSSSSGGLGGGGAGGAGGSSTKTSGGNGGNDSSSAGATGGSVPTSGSSGFAGAGGRSSSGGGSLQGGSSASSRSSWASGGADAGIDGSNSGDSGAVAKVSRSGCSCTVGRAQSSSAGWFPPLVLVGVAGLTRCLRRRRISRHHSWPQGAGR